MIYNKDISDVIRVLSESGFEEAEIRLDDLYIRVSSGSVDADAGKRRPSMPESVGAAGPEDRGDENRPAFNSTPATTDMDAGGTLKDIKASTLGTFYRAPSPGAPPFVKVGDRVAGGQAIGLVEVMKLFNTVEADMAGTVVTIHAEDGALVEYDQVLVTLRVG